MKAGGGGSLTVRKRDAETAQMTLRREWSALEETASLRREGAHRLLEHLLACLPPGSRGMDLLAETTIGRLLVALEDDLVLRSRVRKPDKLLDRALLWLHEQEVIRLHKGLAVFRPAMTIKLEQETPRRGFANVDFEPLKLHYQGQVLQIHVMVEYARRGLEAMADALNLAMDYFSLGAGGFPWSVAAGSGQGDRAADHAGVVAGHRREPAQSSPAAHRRRRPGADQRSGARRSGLRQDPGPGPPHRLSRACQARESPRHPRPGLQPARRGRDPSPPGRINRR